MPNGKHSLHTILLISSSTTKMDCKRCVCILPINHGERALRRDDYRRMCRCSMPTVFFFSIFLFALTRLRVALGQRTFQWNSWVALVRTEPGYCSIIRHDKKMPKMQLPSWLLPISSSIHVSHISGRFVRQTEIQLTVCTRPYTLEPLPHTATHGPYSDWWRRHACTRFPKCNDMRGMRLIRRPRRPTTAMPQWKANRAIIVLLFVGSLVAIACVSATGTWKTDRILDWKNEWKREKRQSRWRYAHHSSRHRIIHPTIENINSNVDK